MESNQEDKSSTEVSNTPDNEVETHLLPEEPASESDFPNHRRIVDSLERTVTSSDSGQSIALLGDLGSGKTTIIEILKKRLDSNDGDLNPRLIAYDAWTHRGESMRRAFIQELAEELRDTDWEPECLDKEMERVTHRHTESNTKLSLFGLLLALFGILVPPAVLLISSAGSTHTLHTVLPLLGGSDVGMVATVVSSVVICLAVVFLLGTVLYLICSNKSTQEVISSELNTQRTEREPSTVDFRKAFEGIVGQLLEDSDRRLVIAIENMDRLSSSQVQRYWSTLQTFFSIHRPARSSQQENQEWRSRFWTIVPFSKSKLSVLERKPFIGDYIDKTFQMTLRVSQPVSSDYENFFQKKFGEAFPRLRGSEVADKVRKLYNAGVHTRLEQSPRSVKRFLNDLVGSVRMWGRKPISIPIQAIYHRSLGEGREFIKDVRREDRMDLATESIICGIDPEEIREELVMLHFGTDRDTALQFLFGPDVEEPLDEGDPEQLRELERKIAVGFDIALRDRVLSKASRGRFNDIASATLALEGIEQEGSAKKARRRLAEGLRETDQWEYFTSEVGNGIAKLLLSLDEEEYEKTAPLVLKSISHLS